MQSIERVAGFSLLEMMAVILIVALVSSLVVAASPGTGRAGLKAVTLEAAALLRRERVRAVLGKRSVEVRLDAERRGLVGDDGDWVGIPRDVGFDLLGIDTDAGGYRVVARFDPDGSSSGAVLRFSRDEAGYEIRLNWFTGAVAIAQR